MSGCPEESRTVNDPSEPDSPLSSENGAEQCCIDGEGDSPSKKQRLSRKERKRLKYEQTKIAMKVSRDGKRKQRRQRQRQARKAMAASRGEGPMSRQERRESIKLKLEKARSEGLRVCIDCRYCHLMSEKEQSRLAQQIGRCYPSNKRASEAAHLCLANLEEDSFLYKECIRVNDGFEHYMIDRLSAPVHEAFARDDIVYLSPDAKEVLEHVEKSKIYVIGGLVDESVKKNATLETVNSNNLKSARLPIEEYMQRAASGSYNKILALNQVFDILLKFVETSDWYSSLPVGVPSRKGYLPKLNSGGDATVTTTTAAAMVTRTVASTIPFIKYEGCGNDFVLIDNRDGRWSRFFESESALERLCDRNFGVGADGVLEVRMSERGDCGLNYYNSDGRLGSLCGNGTRCCAHYVTGLLQKDDIEIEACTGMVKAVRSVGRDGAAGKGGMVKIQFRDVNVADITQYVENELFLNTGSPHLIIRLQAESKMAEHPVEKEGRQRRNSERFAAIGGTNVNFIQNIDDETVRIRTYERGVEAETKSCGTGAVAAALALDRMQPGRAERTIGVVSVGGRLDVSFERCHDKYVNVFLEGSVTATFEGHYYHSS